MMKHYIVKIETINRTIEHRIVDYEQIEDFEAKVIQELEEGTVTLDTEEGDILLIVPYNLVSVSIKEIN